MNTITKRDLEDMLLDEAAEPKALPFYLLAEITNGFSADLEIGKGGFAVVYKAMLENEYVAVKRLSSNSYLYEKEFHREIECLMKVKHKNIVQFLGYCADTHGNVGSYNGKFVMADLQHRLLCFEYLPKGSLRDYIEDAYSGLEWIERYKIIKGICEGLYYLHQKNILHLDLKPDNILLDENMRPKITDFGLSRCFEEDQSRIVTSKVGGTRGYLAPEFNDNEITYKFDLYSLGVIIIEILTGKRGYQDIEDVLDNWSNRLQISQGSPDLELIKVCAEIGVECTEFNPKKRPTSVKDIIDRLNQTQGDEVIDFPSKQDKKHYKISDNMERKSMHNGEPKFRRLEELRKFTDIFSHELEEGPFAIVYKGIDDEENEIAVKILKERIESKHEEQFKREFEILVMLNHPNIIQLVGYCYESDKIYNSVLRKSEPIMRTALCFEYASEGNLGKYLRAADDANTLDWGTCYKIIKGICEGLCYLHNHPSGSEIWHLDLIPDNIWLHHDMVPKIADFGLSELNTGQTSKAIMAPVGSRKYMPLEFREIQVISKETDIYSLGIIIIEMIAGTKTYEDTDYFSQEHADIAFEKWRPKLSRNYYEQVKTCLRIALKCVVRNQHRRPQVRNIIEDLNKVEHMTPKVILYVTTQAGMGKTLHKCNTIRAALQFLNVEFIEKDLLDRPDHVSELTQLLVGNFYKLSLPVLSINGLAVGDARNLLRLHSEGRLQELFE